MAQDKNREEIQVGIADLKVAKNSARLITLGLGSCVGVGLYDSTARVAGLLHLMLPDSTAFSKVAKEAKFANLGIPLLVNEMKKEGANVSRIVAKLVGGAQMFSGSDEKLTLNIGERNVKATKQLLKEMGIKILGEDTGGNQGKTMILDSTDGKVYVRTLGKNQTVI